MYVMGQIAIFFAVTDFLKNFLSRSWVVSASIQKPLHLRYSLHLRYLLGTPVLLPYKIDNWQLCSIRVEAFRRYCTLKHHRFTIMDSSSDLQIPWSKGKNTRVTVDVKMKLATKACGLKRKYEEEEQNMPIEWDRRRKKHVRRKPQWG